MPYSLGLLGFPLEHSLSPRLHSAALQALDLIGEYQLYPVPSLPQGTLLLRGLLEGLCDGHLHGLNVTIPHKQSVLPYLRHASETVQAMGAANTLYCRQGELFGENTDVQGFVADVRAKLGLDLSSPGRALVLGAGGSARAVVYALRQAGWRVIVAARRLEQAQALVDSFPKPASESHFRAVPLEKSKFKRLTSQVDLLVNATPAGMWPQVEGNPWPKGVSLPPGAAVYDLIYNPDETPLLRMARAAGHAAANGLGMLVEQAALAFEYWIGLEAPRQAMWQAVAQYSTPADPQDKESA